MHCITHRTTECIHVLIIASFLALSDVQVTADGVKVEFDLLEKRATDPTNVPLLMDVIAFMEQEILNNELTVCNICDPSMHIRARSEPRSSYKSHIIQTGKVASGFW